MRANESNGLRVKEHLGLGTVRASFFTKKTSSLSAGESTGSQLAKTTFLGVRTLTEAEFEAPLRE